MTKETYLKMTQPFRDNPKLAKSLHIANKILTGMIFAAYPLLLIWLFIRRDPGLLRGILIPLDGFLAVSVFRAMVNRRRPYEKFQTSPIIPKDTKGKSFPSRHVFSAAVIAMIFLIQPGFLGAGIFLMVCAAALAVIRVVSGVHYISDVAAAFVFAAAVFGIGIYLF